MNEIADGLLLILVALCIPLLAGFTVIIWRDVFDDPLKRIRR